jgi:cytochrome c6
MKNVAIIAGGFLVLSSLALSGCKDEKKEAVVPKTAQPAAVATPAAPVTQTAASTTGEELFKQHCAACHPNGENITMPGKALQHATLEASGIKNAEGIIGMMRNPGPGMTKFDSQTLPEEDAQKIAEYIISTFK